MNNFFLLQGRTHIFKIHARSMSVERDIRYELLARLCPNCTGMSLVLIRFTIKLLRDRINRIQLYILFTDNMENDTMKTCGNFCAQEKMMLWPWNVKK